MTFRMELGKEWIIERRYISSVKPQPDEWAFHHRDYDGPEDPRIGFSQTLEGIYDQIRELNENAEG